jgi:hypothetical protein
VHICGYIVSEFLPFNSEYIHFRYRVYDRKELKGKTIDGAQGIQRTANRYPKLHKKNIAILMNNRSASASEILISALKDRKDMAGAILIGDTTYGKGIGQSHILRPGREILSITSLQIRGLTNRTGDYHRKGIYPDKLVIPEAGNHVDSCVYYAVEALESSSAADNIIWGKLPKTSPSLAKTAPIGAYFILDDPLNE